MHPLQLSSVLFPQLDRCLPLSVRSLSFVLVFSRLFFFFVSFLFVSLFLPARLDSIYYLCMVDHRILNATSLAALGAKTS